MKIQDVNEYDALQGRGVLEAKLGSEAGLGFLHYRREGRVGI